MSQERLENPELSLSESGRKVLARLRSLDASTATSYAGQLEEHIKELGAGAVLSFYLKGDLAKKDQKALQEMLRIPRYVFQSAAVYGRGQERVRMELLYNIQTSDWSSETQGNADLIVTDVIPLGRMLVYPAHVRSGELTIDRDNMREYGELEWQRDPNLVPNGIRKIYEQYPAINEPRDIAS